MRQPSASSKRLVAAVVVVAAVAAGLVIVLLVGRGTQGPVTSLMATERIVSDFYSSLAALDVEQNERAARVLQEAVDSEPREPALWANLAVAQMRLRDMESSSKSLERALALAGDSRDLARLRAEVLEHSGRMESAIEQLRQLHRDWPENIAVTYSLVTLLGGVRSDRAEAERLSLLSDILTRVPGNVRARCEQARVAAKLEQGGELQSALDALLGNPGSWPSSANQRLSQADQAARQGDFRSAALSLTIFENLLKPQPQYQRSLEQLGVNALGAIGTPLRTFLRLELPAVEVAGADANLSFQLQHVSGIDPRPGMMVIVEQSGRGRSVLASLSDSSVQIGDFNLSGAGFAAETNSASICAADLNFDFLQDVMILGNTGCRVFLGHTDGSYAEHTLDLDEFQHRWQSVWCADVDADGDLDPLLSDHQSPLRWMRNNGDMTFTAMDQWIGAEDVVTLDAADFDTDGDLDLATLDATGMVSIWRNERSGVYVEIRLPSDEPRLAIAIADVDRDGKFDLISLGKSGDVFTGRWNADGSWSESLLVAWSPPDGSLADVSPGEAFLTVADVDNNGRVDLIASVQFVASMWLRTAGRSWMPLSGLPAMHLSSVADINGDGLLDLAGKTTSGGRIAVNQSRAGYGWHILEPTANPRIGDKRVNSFGLGGRVEIRAGYDVQAAAIRSPRVHFGLGKHKQVDVARIVWPNGTVQAEFDLRAGQLTVANQRLKGSCPWVFAFDGQQFRFVKDFLWRSPLGLRINAQTTAGVVQTEDWIKIAGSRLAATNGRYSLRITGELWETLFFDHVSLLAVDHPGETEVIVDERFVPNESPKHRVVTTSRPRPLERVTDHHGNRLDMIVQSADGVYADGFDLGEYQGVAEEHWIEFELADDISTDRKVMIVGNGWIYPTDSSLNVAIGQRDSTRPFGLLLEQRDTSGQWRTALGNLGFPAGKNKDIVIEVPVDCLSAGRRLRLRTNMEIYWDRLAWCYARDDVEPRMATVPMRVAHLRRRGFSRMSPIDRRRPDMPIYEVNATEQRWLDLEGFYTRVGDVIELVADIDDRYVIMNAGDELLFQFDALPDVPPGWRRDFVLVGDGWVKDGDINTAFSRWVRPLPSHGNPEYVGPLLPLEDDPVFARHTEDWYHYHTRYIRPRRFERGLWTHGRAMVVE